MKTVKLNTHPKNYSKDDILICQKYFPNIRIGDVVEIYSPEDNYSRLLLQICNFSDKQGTTAISIEQTIASTFQLRNFSDVYVNVVDPNTVPLDSVELFFKDQYLARSDMWRLKKYLTNSIVYLNRKIEFSNIRCQVFEMWSQGLRMASGYVNEETKVVFRSASSMVYLFLQMSSEMWDYDINGDLYFEKAVNGFLSDLFTKWKTFNCSHDVTIVLFSRSFYEAVDINEFPKSMHECLQQDSKGRFYEDFYQVAVQNERFDDWTQTLIRLRKLFNLYEKEVIYHHKTKGVPVPRAYNSTASQGNFLEVLNMSLNVFERHNLDRSFDRTGQLSVVISPGVGVYEVDLDLTNITKQRIIDNGIGSDLVCLGEQPLHAVPLFKFNSRHPKNDEYNMPHWINLSFYSSKRRFSSNFIPRIKMPNVWQNNLLPPKRSSLNLPSFVTSNSIEDATSESFPNSNNFSVDLKSCQQIQFIDYDEFDKQVFRVSGKEVVQQNQPRKNFDSPKNLTPEPHPRRRLSEVTPLDSDYKNSMTPPSNSPTTTDTIDGISINDTTLRIGEKAYSCSLSNSVDIKSSKDYRHRLHIQSKDDIIVSNYKNDIHMTKALINPFDPSQVTIKLNSNRRRWTHVFPLGPTGTFMQQHHYQAIPQNKESSIITYPSMDASTDGLPKNSSLSNFKFTDMVDGSSKLDYDKDIIKWNNKSRTNLSIDNKIEDAHQKKRSVVLTDNSSLWAWGATGEQEWTPAITTGVDWKSLVMPACLPITTDFLPDKRTLQHDYVTSVYDLLPEVQASEFFQKKILKNEDGSDKFIIDQFYNELICQRLQQGFQIILLPKNESKYSFSDRTGNRYTFILSIGRIYHELAHKENKISIMYYHPRHPYKANNIRYGYRIRTPDNETYGVSWVDFTSEKLEAYKWNYLDNFICQRGDNSEYQLMENLKYWRFRLLVLPTRQSITKKIIDKYISGEDDFQSDIYGIMTHEEKIQLQNGFLKLLEAINGIKRSTNRQTITASRLEQCKGKLNRRNSSGQLPQSILKSAAYQNRLSQPSEKLMTVINELPVNKPEPEPIEPVSELMDLNQLSIKSPDSQIIEAMKLSVNFLKLTNLPEFTFISSEMIDWVMKNVDLVKSDTDAEIMFQSFTNKDLIRHASGDKNQRFKRGFYLYSIMTDNNRKLFDSRFSDVRAFEREWMEVGVVQQHTNPKNLEIFYEHSEGSLSHDKVDIPEFTFKNFTYDLESKNKAQFERAEWINVKFHSLYDPEQAFELIIEWMVATGNAIPEIVSQWGRAKNTGLHIVPIPWDPFALPFSSRSDPLRGPIYLSLNIDCLPPNILEGEQLFNFQEKILSRFGFLPFHDPSTDNQRQFVQVSGSIFVMIPSKNPSSSPFKSVNKRGRFLKAINQELACSPHEEYITRHFSGNQDTKHDTNIDAKIGFLWCWNYMITKRWKTNMTGDENSMRKLLADFRDFCSNQHNRLEEFWKQSQQETQPKPEIKEEIKTEE